jgi:hypothetical protein
MTPKSRSHAVAAALSIAVCLISIRARGEEPRASAAADLSGRWTLNAELSDDARAKMREAMEKRGPRGEGGGPGGMGGPGGGMGGPGGGMAGPGGGGGGMGGPGGGGADGPREAMRALFEPAEELTVTQSESEIAIDEKFGRLRRLHPDGKKYKTDNGTAEIKSYWKDGKLVVETKRNRGASAIETWERVPDGSRLIVSVRLEGGLGPRLELKRIYDLAPAAGQP